MMKRSVYQEGIINKTMYAFKIRASKHRKQKVKDFVSPIVGDFESFLSVLERTNKHTQENKKGYRNLSNSFSHIDIKQIPHHWESIQYFQMYTWHISQNRLRDKHKISLGMFCDHNKIKLETDINEISRYTSKSWKLMYL